MASEWHTSTLAARAPAASSASSSSSASARRSRSRSRSRERDRSHRRSSHKDRSRSPRRTNSKTYSGGSNYSHSKGRSHSGNSNGSSYDDDPRSGSYRRNSKPAPGSRGRNDYNRGRGGGRFGGYSARPARENSSTAVARVDQKIVSGASGVRGDDGQPPMPTTTRGTESRDSPRRGRSSPNQSSAAARSRSSSPRPNVDKEDGELNECPQSAPSSAQENTTRNDVDDDPPKAAALADNDVDPDAKSHFDPPPSGVECSSDVAVADAAAPSASCSFATTHADIPFTAAEFDKLEERASLARNVDTHKALEEISADVCQLFIPMCSLVNSHGFLMMNEFAETILSKVAIGDEKKAHCNFMHNWLSDPVLDEMLRLLRTDYAHINVTFVATRPISDARSANRQTLDSAIQWLRSWVRDKFGYEHFQADVFEYAPGQDEKDTPLSRLYKAMWARGDVFSADCSCSPKLADPRQRSRFPAFVLPRGGADDFKSMLSAIRSEKGAFCIGLHAPPLNGFKFGLYRRAVV